MHELPRALEKDLSLYRGSVRLSREYDDKEDHTSLAAPQSLEEMSNKKEQSSMILVSKKYPQHGRHN